MHEPRSESLHFVALSGSLRAGSSNTALLQAAALVAPEDMRVTVYDGLGRLPLFTPDLENDLPEEAQALRDLLCSCDGILIASPEYAHGVPGAFKNALDWVVGCAELGAKPVALLNSSGRAVHAQAALAEILTTMGLTIIEPASLTIPVSGKRLDAEGIASDAQLAALLATALKALASVHSHPSQI